MLVKMGIQYDSEDALQTIEQIMQIFRDTAYETSIELSSEKGLSLTLTGQDIPKVSL